ncbi:MAG TPA: PaaI family thioesterase [Patescibacteria group bacterium]|nr:PaaI family thioesterase [Patescibacteria group bacterium]
MRQATATSTPSRRRAAADAKRVPRRPTKRDVEGAFDFEPHRCFACGELNEHGLHLGIHTDPGGSWTETTLEPRFQGWEAVAHGGIVCTLLDEVMAWAVIGRGTWGVTARLNVTFRRPIPVGRAIRAEGWVVDQNRRAHRAEGRVIDAGTGEVLATGESTFVAVPPTEVERLKARYGMRRLANQPDITGATDRSDQESSGDTDQTGAAGERRPAPERVRAT